ncbi:MAG: bile acid:sodium symporter family protein [Rhodospirillales bacterium]|nr:bile acid:sodium symporter family protein [Rhodospirillales bacterium]
MVTQILLPLSLAFIMFSMGLALVVDDFRRVLKYPKAMIYGLSSQMVLLPLIAFFIAIIFPMNPEFAVGIVILAACPGGITSNLLTHLARGDTALSVSLTAVTSLVGVLTVPLIVNLGLAHFVGMTEMVNLPIGKMVLGVFVISTLPLLAGMALRHYKEMWALWIEPKARKAATFVFVLIVAATFTGQWGSITDHFVEIGPAVVALNILTMGAGFFGARWLYLDRGQSVAISLECGLQNAAMGIFVAATLLANTMMVIPSVIYALVMNVTAAVVIFATTKTVRRLFFTR